MESKSLALWKSHDVLNIPPVPNKPVTQHHEQHMQSRGTAETTATSPRQQTPCYHRAMKAESQSPPLWGQFCLTPSCDSPS